MTWPRPVPLIGDQTSAAERAAAPDAWAFSDAARTALYDVIGARRDIRRFRPDPVPREVLDRVLSAAHQAPSVGHSQPWRFIVVTDPSTRERAARMADEQRLRQARHLEPDAARRLLDLQLEGIREAPYGVVVACDRRTPATGVLGRATFPDADLWSCACAIENLWLSARAEGLGLGWVTLFDPDELHTLLGLPDGVVTLGWLCLGWPDERPPAPGLERTGWSKRQPLSEVVLEERWSESAAPVSHLRAPSQLDVVEARDEADARLTPPGSLGVLDRAVDRLVSATAGRGDEPSGALLLVGGRHLVTRHGVSAFPDSVTDDVLAASAVGESAAAAAAAAAGLSFGFVDAGTATGDLLTSDPLTAARVAELIAIGEAAGSSFAEEHQLLALGEVGIGNTTVAAALTAALLDLPAEAVVGLGAGSDTAMLERKRLVVAGALARVGGLDTGLVQGLDTGLVRGLDTGLVPRPYSTSRGDSTNRGDSTKRDLLAALGGPEFCVLVGAVLGAAAGGAVVVLDGLATSVAALIACRREPGVAAYLIAGQRSRERAHEAVLDHLGLEPLLDLRLRAGEGVGAALASSLVLAGLRTRRAIGVTR